MKANANDILIFTATRGTLKAAAHFLSHMDEAEADRFLTTLADEVAALKSKDATSKAWRQGVEAAGLEGALSYALERLGLWPDRDSDGNPREKPCT